MKAWTQEPDSLALTLALHLTSSVTLVSCLTSMGLTFSVCEMVIEILPYLRIVLRVK